MIQLTVVEPFEQYVPGDVITDAELVDRLMQSGCVVRVTLPDAAKPDAVQPETVAPNAVPAYVPEPDAVTPNSEV